MSKLLVAGEGGMLRTVEIINLDESSPNFICDNLPDLPKDSFGAIGQLSGSNFPDLPKDSFGAIGQLSGTNFPVVCGGHSITSSSDLCDCFAFQNGAWIGIASLNSCRKFFASAKIDLSNGNFTEKVIAAFGGTSDNQPFSSIEAFDGQTWEEGKIADLPQSQSQFCIAAINETTLISIGGVENNGGKRTYFYNSLKNEWTSGPNLTTSRNGPSCGLIHWLNPSTGKREKVVVAAAGDDLASVDLLNLAEFEESGLGWIAGPSLPKKAFLSTMVEYENSVILIDGDGGVDGLHLFRLDSPQGQWIQLRQTLKQTRFAHVSFLVPDELVNCY
jgi:hypothetical protein